MIFYDTLKNNCKEERYAKHEMLIGGDFNLIIDFKIDKKGENIPPKSTNSSLISLIEIFSLHDIWRGKISISSIILGAGKSHGYFAG